MQVSEAAGVSFVAERDAIARYADATNERDDRFVRGDVAPPLFGVVAAWDAITGAAAAFARSGRVVHVAHRADIVRPVVAGMRLRSAAAVAGTRPVGPGTIAVVRADTTDGDGPVCTHWLELLFDARTQRSGDPRLPPLADRGPAGVAARVVTDRVGADQPARYAAASGDRMPMHLDERFARDAGFDGVILHGLCTLAFAIRAVAQAVGRPPCDLRAATVRFAGPVYPPADIETTVACDRHAPTFETTAGGVLVLKRGRALFGDVAAKPSER